MAKVGLQDAFTAGFLLEHGLKNASRYPLAGYTTEEMRERLSNAFDEWLGDRLPHGDDPVPEVVADGEIEEDLDLVYKLLDTARRELVDMALGANIERAHHLESAVASFEDVGVLFQAERIIRECIDIREDPEDIEENESED